MSEKLVIELQVLSRQMLEVAQKMIAFDDGKNEKMIRHGRELASAASVANKWADDIHRVKHDRELL
jgi:hypothetical protein